MKKLIVILICAAALASCTASLYPVVSEETVIYKKELLGSWRSDGTIVYIDQYLSSAARSKPFGEDDSLLNPVTPIQKRAKAYAAKSYLIRFTEKQVEFVYEARLTSIGGQLYAEVLPYSLPSENEPFSNHESGFAIAKVELSPTRVALQFLDGDKLKSLATSGKLKIDYEHEKLFDQFIITANTSELRQFLEKYGSDERLFNKTDGIILTR